MRALYLGVKGTLNNLLSFSYCGTPNVENTNLRHEDLSIPIHGKGKDGFEVRFKHPEDIPPHIENQFISRAQCIVRRHREVVDGKFLQRFEK